MGAKRTLGPDNPPVRPIHFFRRPSCVDDDLLLIKCERLRNARQCCFHNPRLQFQKNILFARLVETDSHAKIFDDAAKPKESES